MALLALILNEKYLSFEIRLLYVKFMQEYIDLGHMEEVPSSEIAISPRYYLPHHAVFRPCSLTTKLRTVFNTSVKNTTGCSSLNDALMVGIVI